MTIYNFEDNYLGRWQWRVTIDWNRNGLFDHDLSDITEYIKTLECTRGRNASNTLRDRSVAGKATIDLNHFWNVSTIENLAVPKVRIKIELGAPTNIHIEYRTAWTGFLESYLPNLPVGQLNSTKIIGYGAISALTAEEDLTFSITAPTTTGDAFRGVMELTDLTPNDYEIRQTESTMTYFHAEGSALEIVKQIEEVESGFISEDEHGKIIFEGRHARTFPGHNSPENRLISDQLDGDDTELLRMKHIERFSPLETIVNDASISLKTAQTRATIEELYTVPAEIFIRPEESFRIELRPEDVGALAVQWVDPIGQGTLPVISGIEYETETTAYSFTMVIRNTTQQARTVPVFTISGQSTVEVGELTIRGEETESIQRYGRRKYRIPADNIFDRAEAADYLGYILALYREPKHPITITTSIGRHSGQMIRFLLDDYLTISNLIAVRIHEFGGYNKLYYLENITIRANVDTGHIDAMFGMSESYDREAGVAVTNGNSEIGRAWAGF